MYIGKVSTERRQSKIVISLMAIENNESADVKNSKDTVMSGVDRGPEWSRSEEEKESTNRETSRRRMMVGCAVRVAERHKGRKVGRGYKGTSNQPAAVDERDFGFLLSIDTKKEMIPLLYSETRGGLPDNPKKNCLCD